jgi:hypothetical protein
MIFILGRILIIFQKDLNLVVHLRSNIVAEATSCEKFSPYHLLPRMDGITDDSHNPKTQT